MSVKYAKTIAIKLQIRITVQKNTGLDRIFVRFIELIIFTFTRTVATE